MLAQDGANIPVMHSWTGRVVKSLVLGYRGVKTRKGLGDMRMHIINHMDMQVNGGIRQTASDGKHRGAWSEHPILKRGSSLMQSRVHCFLQGNVLVNSWSMSVSSSFVHRFC